MLEREREREGKRGLPCSVGKTISEKDEVTQDI
jgi:hypothetical protein